MVAGAGVLESSNNSEGALALLTYLLSEPAQQYFADETYEYPLIEGVSTHEVLTPLSNLKALDIALADLSDLQGTVDLLSEVGALP